MSDIGRKDWSTKAKEGITPDSSKSTLDRTKEGVTDTVDKVSGEAQSDSSKGTAQSAFDKGKREKDGTFVDNVKVFMSMNVANMNRTPSD
jgi:Heat shock protein 9/12